MLKIGLVGYGKMGRLIEEAALQKGHCINAKTSRHLDIASFKQSQVCIDFSHPESVMDNIRTLAAMGKNLVIGTTGWYDHLDEVKSLVSKYQIGFIYSPNFSVGVNLFLKVVEEAAALIDAFPDYDVGLFEAHHNQKADSPSGTAKAIADTLVQQIRRKTAITDNNSIGRISPNELHVTSLRCGSIPGTHSVIFDSPSDSITLTHQARDREGFARGAVTAAEWLNGKKGFYTIEDMFGRAK